jgi:hypothetical protein
MSNHFCIEDKKEILIQQLISLGVFKKGEQHLFELEEGELEEEYTRLTNG